MSRFPAKVNYRNVNIICRERMECWAALAYCKRDLDRGAINPRNPKDFRHGCELNIFKRAKSIN